MKLQGSMVVRLPDLPPAAAEPDGADGRFLMLWSGGDDPADAGAGETLLPLSAEAFLPVVDGPVPAAHPVTWVLAMTSGEPATEPAGLIRRWPEPSPPGHGVSEQMPTDVTAAARHPSVARAPALEMDPLPTPEARGQRRPEARTNTTRQPDARLPQAGTPGQTPDPGPRDGNGRFAPPADMPTRRAAEPLLPSTDLWHAAADRVPTDRLAAENPAAETATRNRPEPSTRMQPEVRPETPARALVGSLARSFFPPLITGGEPATRPNQTASDTVEMPASPGMPDTPAQTLPRAAAPEQAHLPAMHRTITTGENRSDRRQETGPTAPSDAGPRPAVVTLGPTLEPAADSGTQVAFPSARRADAPAPVATPAADPRQVLPAPKAWRPNPGALAVGQVPTAAPRPAQSAIFPLEHPHPNPPTMHADSARTLPPMSALTGAVVAPAATFAPLAAASDPDIRKPTSTPDMPDPGQNQPRNYGSPTPVAVGQPSQPGTSHTARAAPDPQSPSLAARHPTPSPTGESPEPHTDPATALRSLAEPIATPRVPPPSGRIGPAEATIAQLPPTFGTEAIPKDPGPANTPPPPHTPTTASQAPPVQRLSPVDPTFPATWAIAIAQVTDAHARLCAQPETQSDTPPESPPAGAAAVVPRAAWPPPFATPPEPKLASHDPTAPVSLQSHDVRPLSVHSPPSAPPPSQQSPRPMPTQQIAEAIRTASGHQVQVTLAPEELGRVSLSFQQDGDSLRVHLVAERPETLDLLRRHSPDLAADLRAAGYDGTSFSFGRPGRGTQPEPAPADPATVPDNPIPETPRGPRAPATGTLDLRL